MKSEGFRYNDNRCFFRKSFFILGMLTSVSLAGYGLLYIIGMPAVSPDEFVPKTLGNELHNSFKFGFMQPIFILVYAFAFLPVIILFTIKKYRSNPYAFIIACCMITVSLILEIVNNLPLVAIGLYNSKLAGLSPEIPLLLVQRETIKYLSYDVAGFTLLYLGFFIYAIVFLKSYRILSYSVIASILLFIANVPFLWFAPKMAVMLMAISVFVFAIIPIYLAKMTIEEVQSGSK